LDKVLSLLGLCKKAGRLASGSFAAEKAVKEGKAQLVIIAEDASENTKKLFLDKCGYRSVPVVLYGTKDEIGKVTGASERACIAVLDSGFAGSIIRQIRL